MTFFKKLFGIGNDDDAPVQEEKIETKSSPEEIAKHWRRQLAAEGRKIDTQMRKIKLEEQKIKIEMKKAAKMGDTYVMKSLAKNVLHARKSCKQLMTAKTQMNSISMQLQHQMANMKVVGTMAKSGEIMTSMNNLIKINDVRNTMMTMSKEMMKAGLIDEMMSEGIDDALGDVEEDELDEEVNKVIEDVMQDKLKGTRVTGSRLPQKQQVSEEAEAEEVAEEEDDDELMAKYNALKGN